MWQDGEAKNTKCKVCLFEDDELCQFLIRTPLPTKVYEKGRRVGGSLSVRGSGSGSGYFPYLVVVRMDKRWFPNALGLGSPQCDRSSVLRGRLGPLPLDREPDLRSASG